MRGSLEAILQFAVQLIPTSELPTTPIYFFATAGLRVLAEEKGERIYDDDDEDLDYMLDLDDDDYGQGDIAKLLHAIYSFVSSHYSFIIHPHHIKV